MTRPSLPVPAPAKALEVAVTSKGRWVGHTELGSITRAPFGTVWSMMTRVVAHEHQAGAEPEIGCLFTWLLMPRQPARCVSAVAYRAAVSMHSLSGGDQVYSDTIDLMPQTAWALCLSDDPVAWYASIKDGE